MPTDVNPKLTEFSLNLALQEDTSLMKLALLEKSSGSCTGWNGRGAIGTPNLRYFPIDYHQTNNIQKYLPAFDTASYDELSPELANEDEEVNQVTVTLIYPHWRAGTIPLTRRPGETFPHRL